MAFYKDTSHTELLPTLMISFNLNHLLKTISPNIFTFEDTGGWDFNMGI